MKRHTSLASRSHVLALTVACSLGGCAKSCGSDQAHQHRVHADPDTAYTTDAVGCDDIDEQTECAGVDAAAEELRVHAALIDHVGTGYSLVLVDPVEIDPFLYGFGDVGYTYTDAEDHRDVLKSRMPSMSCSAYDDLVRKSSQRA
jgi:hypothetical protein